MDDSPDATNRFRGAAQRWWPVPAILLVALSVQGVFHRLAFGSPRGHAAGHLQSAGASFFVMAMFAIIVWATPSSKRTWTVWLAGALLALSLAPAAIGNYQVVDALEGTNYSDGQATALIGTLPGLEEGHDLAERWMLLPAIAATLLAAALWRNKSISLGVAIAAAVFSFLFPPWMIPAFGVVIMAFATCRRRARDRTLEMQPAQ